MATSRCMSGRVRGMKAMTEAPTTGSSTMIGQHREARGRVRLFEGEEVGHHQFTRVRTKSTSRTAPIVSASA